MNRIATTIALAISAAAVFGTGTAHAQSIKVKCETRSDRSRASVDGLNLAGGDYMAVLVSGGKKAETEYQRARRGEVEFDFDSNRADINEGATAIPRDFIVDGRATGKLLNSSGRVVAQRTVTCRVR